jgi:hypothetical protein
MNKKSPSEQPLIWNRSNMTVRELREEGYAVIIWTPEELGDCPTDVMEDISIERGWVLLEHYENEEEEDDE